MDAPLDGASRAELEEEVRRLRVINRVLIERVEREMDPAASSAFSLFYNTVTVDSSVTQRTTALTNLARRLMQEIAERREAEAALMEAKAAAEQANESKTNFLAAVSHDLRQPLHAARLFLGEVGEQAPPGRAGELLPRIEGALDTMDDMLESLLDMSRLQSGAWRVEPETFPLAPLIARLAAEFEGEAAAAGLRLRHIANSASVRTDRRLLERILRNLIANAVHYTGQGGVVIGCRNRGGSVRIDVIDSGVGIPPDKWDIIFQEFRQLGVAARQGAKGLGLGLSIVERAARLLQIRIDVASVPGRGSRFSLTLPRAAAPAQAPRGDVPLPAASALPRSTVLVVEDDVAVRDSLCGLLRNWQCHAIQAASTAEALGALAKSQAPDIVIADYHLSETDTGLHAIAALRARAGAAIPALLMSSDRDPALRGAAREAGIMFLQKPVAPSKLRASLAYLLAG